MALKGKESHREVRSESTRSQTFQGLVGAREGPRLVFRQPWEDLGRGMTWCDCRVTHRP